MSERLGSQRYSTRKDQTAQTFLTCPSAKVTLSLAFRDHSDFSLLPSYNNLVELDISGNKINEMPNIII